jgi:hypothetical protein
MKPYLIAGIDMHFSHVFLAAMDISSDLTELGRTPVAVISAGVKSILDIPRTLEYLVHITFFTPYNFGSNSISDAHISFKNTGDSGRLCCCL